MAECFPEEWFTATFGFDLVGVSEHKDFCRSFDVSYAFLVFIITGCEAATCEDAVVAAIAYFAVVVEFVMEAWAFVG